MEPDRDAYEVLQVHPRADAVVIRAAYHVLAALCHPDRDRSSSATRRMAELNAAYALLRTPESRQAYDGRRAAAQNAAQAPDPVAPPPTAIRVPPPTTGGTGSRLTFGRYTDWTIDQLARRDPEYLRWLSRHSSGVRHRREIEFALGRAASEPSARRVAVG